MKLDDTDWHIGTMPDEVQAGVHIALVYCWLVSKGHIAVEKDQWRDWQEEFRAQKISPGDFFLSYADGKLLSDDIKGSKVKAFLQDWYENKYLTGLDSGDFAKLDHDSKFEVPYNVANTWKNVENASKIFDARFEQWQAEHR